MAITKKIVLALFPLFLATACSTGGVQSESAMQKESQEASQLLSDATATIQQLEADPKIQPFLQNARGIFIVPRFTQAALGVGGQGGEGVLVVKQGNDWRDPVFYNVGGISLGLQAGAERGALALIMNNDNAVQKFVNQNNFHVNASAGFSVANYSRGAQADLSRADMIAWSDTRGLFGGAAIALQDVRYDQSETSGFYGKQDVNISDVISGNAKAPEEKVSSFKSALSASLSGGAGSK